jgi:hypothetical protein
VIHHGGPDAHFLMFEMARSTFLHARMESSRLPPEQALGIRVAGSAFGGRHADCWLMARRASVAQIGVTARQRAWAHELF